MGIMSDAYNRVLTEGQLKLKAYRKKLGSLTPTRRSTYDFEEYFEENSTGKFCAYG